MSLFESLSSSFSGIKNKVVDAAGTLKSSTETFIGDVVIKSAINRLKGGVLNYIEQMNAPENLQRLNEEEQKKRIPKGDSSTLMASLLGGSSGNNFLENHLNEIFKDVGNNLSNRITQTIKQEVENIDPDTVVNILAGVLQSTMASMDKPSDSSQEIPWFKTEATFQVIGLILAALGGLMIASNLNFNSQTREVNPVPQHENKDMAEVNIEADSEIQPDLSSKAANSEVESEEVEPTRTVMGL